MNNEKICLDGKWSLYLAENRVCKDVAPTLSTVAALNKTGYQKIGGTVPGNFELDMMDAGLVPDLFYDENTMLAQRLENMHLWYATTFSYADDDGMARYLRFDGIDTFADIYLNGELIGSADNMLVEHEFDVRPHVGTNELLVHIRPTCIEARKNVFEAGILHYIPYNAVAVTVRKPGHMFGWDIMPRIVSGGIWRSVSLCVRKPDRVEDAYLMNCSADEKKARMQLYYRTAVSGDFTIDYTLRISGVCGDSRFSCEKKMFHTEDFLEIDLPDPVLWWPRGMGAANLYDVSIELLLDGKVLDAKKFRHGVRYVDLVHTESEKDRLGEFHFTVNGEKMYVRGSNWVPLDAFHSRDLANLDRAISLCVESNYNMVRCWGGNVYESDRFFELCDENGIGVWQDFSMACSFYPQDDDFCRVLEREAEKVIRRLRGHASLFLWAGDNECDGGIRNWHPGKELDPNRNVLTRRVLPEVIRRMDPFRPYLPSSPYESQHTVDEHLQNMMPEQHLWGPRGYYKDEFYAKSTARFASETGYHGCPSISSIKKFIAPEKLWPWQNNRSWLVHAACMEPEAGKEFSYRIPLMNSQIEVAFGFTPNTLEEFALASQITQAEADKFMIERNRTRKWTVTSGILYWNVIDGWPQFSDAVVDYYGSKKLAYHVIKNVFRTVVLMCREPEDGVLPLVCSNDSRKPVKITYRVTEVLSGKTVLKGESEVAANAAVEVDKIPVPADKMAFYKMEWEIDGEKFFNHYIYGKAPLDFEKVKEGYRKIGLMDLYIE